MTHRPRKRFGQHFLTDDFIINQIISDIAPKPTDNLIEIGPGLGAITEPLIKQCQKLTVIELDRDVIPPLTRRCEPHGDLTVVQADAMKIDLSTLRRTNEPMRIVGNLPYNISTPILFHLLEYRSQIIDMHFMLQKEVVDRLCASPGNKDYGRLSVMVQRFCDTTYLFDVPPECFDPPPKVNSAVLRITPFTNSPYPPIDNALFATVVNLAFQQRRKTLRNALKRLITEKTFEAAGVDPQSRAEQLSVDDFVNICINHVE